jgi:hypothetical protein
LLLSNFSARGVPGLEAIGQTDSAAQSVLTSAGELTSPAEVLRTEVDRFLESVRAA